MKLLKKPKVDEKKYLSLLLLVLMVGSTFAYSIMQSMGNETSNKVEIPEENIVYYELTNEQKTYIISQGKTLMEYRYPGNCTSCNEEKAFLRAFANEIHNQLFLEILTDDSFTISKLTIASYYGNDNIQKPTESETIEIMCELMVEPPVVCATIHLNK